MARGAAAARPTLADLAERADRRRMERAQPPGLAGWITRALLVLIVVGLAVTAALLLRN